MHPEAVPLFELWLILSTSSPFPQTPPARSWWQEGRKRLLGRAGEPLQLRFSLVVPPSDSLSLPVLTSDAGSEGSLCQSRSPESREKWGPPCISSGNPESTGANTLAVLLKEPECLPSPGTRHLAMKSMKTASAIALSMSCVRERPRETVSSKTAGLPGLQSILCLWEHG